MPLTVIDSLGDTVNPKQFSGPSQWVLGRKEQLAVTLESVIRLTLAADLTCGPGCLPAKAVANLEQSGAVPEYLIRSPITPHRELDLSVRKLPPLLNNGRVAALRKLVENFASFDACCIDREPERFL
jgi:hypothetical protein